MDKESEWFREKYHPVDGKKKKDSVQNRVKKRLEIYQDLVEKSEMLKSLPLDSDSEKKILKLLNTVVIKIEGGKEEDLKVLEDDYKENENTKELHKTSSIFLKNLPAKITFSELE